MTNHCSTGINHNQLSAFNLSTSAGSASSNLWTGIGMRGLDSALMYLCGHAAVEQKLDHKIDDKIISGRRPWEFHH